MSEKDPSPEARAGHAAAVDQPLTLTVHSLPSLPQDDVTQVQRTVSGRWKMFAVLAICAAPVIASYLTYYVIRPEGRRNFGELVEPQRPLPDLQATGLDGQPVNLRSLKGQWLLINIAGGACDAACQDRLYLQRQLREALGKEKDRLDRVWLVSDAAPVTETLKPAMRDATVLRVPEAQLAAWLAPAAQQQLSDHLYLVDPLGTWMMRFPAGLSIGTASRAKADLDRLMRASASWDEPGR
jgi:hypothetical protein